MSEVGSEFHIVPQSSPIPRAKQFHGSYYSEPIVKCEECPSARVCKDIGNFRKNCEQGSTAVGNDNTSAKCIAGTNILLAKLLSKIDKG